MKLSLVRLSINLSNGLHKLVLELYSVVDSMFMNSFSVSFKKLGTTRYHVCYLGIVVRLSFDRKYVWLTVISTYVSLIYFLVCSYPSLRLCFYFCDLSSIVY